MSRPKKKTQKEEETYQMGSAGTITLFDAKPEFCKERTNLKTPAEITYEALREKPKDEFQILINSSDCPCRSIGGFCDSKEHFKNGLRNMEIRCTAENCPFTVKEKATASAKDIRYGIEHIPTGDISENYAKRDVRDMVWEGYESDGLRLKEFRKVTLEVVDD
jgi:hypothetical protein